MTDPVPGLLAAAGIDPIAVRELVARAIAEDLAGGVDATTVSTVPAAARGVAVFVPRADGVVAGLAVAAAVLQAVAAAAGAEHAGAGNAGSGNAGSGNSVEMTFEAADGQTVRAGQPLLRVAGRTRDLLTAERTALNLLCHLSGIATLTASWVAAAPGAVIRDTRKTTPGLRALEKYAVRCGGGANHRMSLSDAALIKDNHVVAAGGVRAAYALVRAGFPDLPVEVECDTVDQVREAIEAGADLVLLDNMAVADLTASVALARVAGVRTEASGGLTLANAAQVAATGVDYIAVGALTHSAPVLDIGLDLAAEPAPDPAPESAPDPARGSL